MPTRLGFASLSGQDGRSHRQPAAPVHGSSHRITRGTGEKTREDRDRRAQFSGNSEACLPLLADTLPPTTSPEPRKLFEFGRKT